MTAPIHRSTRAVVDVVNLLLNSAAWMSTKRIEAETGIHRNTLPQILEELAAQAWVERRLVDGEDQWAIGPELPRIGLTYQRRLYEAAQDLDRRTRHLLGTSQDDLATTADSVKRGA